MGDCLERRRRKRTNHRAAIRLWSPCFAVVGALPTKAGCWFGRSVGRGKASKERISIGATGGVAAAGGFTGYRCRLNGMGQSKLGAATDRGRETDAI